VGLIEAARERVRQQERVCVCACVQVMYLFQLREREGTGAGRGEGETFHTLYVGEEGARNWERELGSVCVQNIPPNP